MRGFVVVWSLAVSIAGLRGQDVPAAERYATARAAAQREVERGALPSLAVAVLEDGDVVWAEGFGLADVAAATPATADTIYRLASISKPFTATAAMLLVERGDLDLDAPVNRYLDGAGIVARRGSSDAITLRRLMNHTAGLPTHWNFFYPGAAPPPRDESIRRYGFAAWEPGTRTNYSNFAFGVVDHVVGRASGRGFRAFMVESVLDPLGMTHTDVGVRHGQEARAAVGYARDGSGRWVPVADYGFDHDGASAVRSSVRDLMRFARLLIEQGEVDGVRVLAAETVRAMREPRAREGGSGFGVGWGVGRTRGALALRHTGGMPGVSTVLQVFPERRAAVAVLTNMSRSAPVNRVLDAVLDTLLGPNEPAAGRATGPTPASDPAPHPAPAPVGDWRGLVAHPDGPIPLSVTLGEVPRVRLGDTDVRSFTRVDTSTDRLRLGFRGLVATRPAFHGALDLELELEPHGEGWGGVLYAVGPSTFRLPHWVELAPVDPKPAGALRVVSYNVLVGFGDHRVGDPYLSGEQRRTAVAAWLAAAAPDVVGFQEMNGYTDARLRREAAAWGHAHAVVLKEDGYPVALTSRWPIEVVARLRDGLHHGFLHARSAGVDYLVVHVVPSPGVERKVRELQPVLAAYRAAIEAGRPIVLLGDFNSIAAADVDLYSEAALERYRAWKYALDGDRPAETAVDVIAAAGAVDVWQRHRSESVELSMPLPRIDFVFASPDLAATSLACRWLAGAARLRWSDHPAVVADFAGR